jgi:hypothetical protein
VGALIFLSGEKKPPRNAKMPRYFFNSVGGATKNIAKDSQGVVLDSVREAEKEAIGFARDLVQHKEIARSSKVVVTDENGTQVLTLSLSEIRGRIHLWLGLRRRFAALESKLGPRTFACSIAMVVVGIIAQASMRRELGTKESQY